MQLSFRLDKRPGESHLALDGKKPSRLALCDLEAPGWEEPRFPHCAVLLLKLTDCGMAFS